MTTEHRVARKPGDRGEGIRELAGGALLVPSFTDPDKCYKTHPDSGYCQCDRHYFTAFCEKHVQFGKAIQAVRARSRGSRWFGRAALENAEEILFELACRIYAPIKTKESYIEAHRLYLEAASCQYTTEEMVKAASKRRDKVLAMHESRRVA